MPRKTLAEKTTMKARKLAAARLMRCLKHLMDQELVDIRYANDTGQVIYVRLDYDKSVSPGLWAR